MGQPPYMRSVDDRNVIMRRMIVNFCSRLTKLFTDSQANVNHHWQRLFLKL